MTENGIKSQILDQTTIITNIDEEIERLITTKLQLINEKIGWPSIILLSIALICNLLGLFTQNISYMVLWISAGLYFYLFYPLLPLFLFPIRYFSKQKNEPKVEKKDENVLKWAKKIKIFKNKRVGFRLFMRFFILSLLPLTIGMIVIYSLSIIYSIYLGNSGVIPTSTEHLILIQSAGIILFYIEIFFFRHQIFNFVEYLRKQDRGGKRKLIILGILGLFLVLIGTVVVILLLIAMLFPGFTLIKFINMSEFVRLSNNFWILLILIGQVIIVQYLQSILSFRISKNMCDELSDRLQTAKHTLSSSSNGPGIEITQEHENYITTEMKEAEKTLRESVLYAFNLRRMFGLFPIVSIGINIPSLLDIENLMELKEVFFDDE